MCGTHLLNPMRLALCLEMGSDRIISKQGKSLMGLSLNLYVMTQVFCFPFLPESVLYFETFSVRKLVDLKNTEIFYTLAFVKV